MKKLEDVKDVPYLKVQPETGIFYVRKFKAGKGALFRSTGVTKKMLAKTIADEMIASWLGNKTVTGRRKRVSEVCVEMLPKLEQMFEADRRRTRTLTKDNTYLSKTLPDLFGDVFVDEIDEHWWDEWVLNKGLALKRDLFDIAKYLSKVMTYAVSKKYVVRKPKFYNPDKPKPRPAIYENDLILEFLVHAEPMLWDLIVLPAENPIRAIEASELRWEFVSFRKDGSVTITLPPWFTKMEKERSFIVSENAAKMLKRRHKECQGDYVFPGPLTPDRPISDKHRSKMWRRMLAKLNAKRVEDKREALPPGLQFRQLRHSFYTKALLDAKVDILKVSEAGGTSVPILQKRYLNSDVQRLAAVSTAVKLDLDSVHKFSTNDSGKMRDGAGRQGKSRDTQGSSGKA